MGEHLGRKLSVEARTQESDPFVAGLERLGAQCPPGNAQVQQIETVLDEGRLEAADRQLKEYLISHPDDAYGLWLMARVQLRQGRRSESVALLGRCLELAPKFTLARFNYAELLLKLKEYQAALDHANQLLATDEDNALLRQLKANILEYLGESADSLALCEQLIAEDPSKAESWINFGHALRAQGLQEQSISAYRRALELRPSSGVAFWSLANMKTVRLSDADVQAMRAQLLRADISADDRVRLQYALGKALEDRGEYASSFEQYAKGNAAMRLRIPYDPEKVSGLVAGSKALFTSEFVESRRGAGCTSAEPIFVVSLPRAGSTLIEQILSTHSMVEGTGELPYIANFARRFDSIGYPKGLETLERDGLAALGKEYLASAGLHRKLNRPRFVDKYPPNHFHVGLIHLILPNAKIIDARRNPGACCFSMFKQYFNKPRPRQAELGRLYRDYVELMAHFDRVLPGRIHRVIYEETIADPEREIRRLLDYLELPFEPACLRFHESKRAVRTPSSEQVRKPISADAVDHWRHYEPWLGPLIKSLGSALTDYPNVPEELR